MRKKLILLVLALAAAAATSAITPASAKASAITPASAKSCPPPQVQVHCDGFTICCYRFEPCICPSP